MNGLAFPGAGSWTLRNLDAMSLTFGPKLSGRSPPGQLTEIRFLHRVFATVNSVFSTVFVPRPPPTR